jgi:uncharacterized protein
MLKPLLALLLLSPLAALGSVRDAEGLTSLHRAAGAGDTARVQSLLREGEDPLALDGKMGVSVLHKAVYSGNPETVALLLRDGALVNQASPSNGNTPLHDALYFRTGHDLRMVRALLTAKPSLAIRNRAGFTPLESAKLLKHTDIAEELGRYEAARQSATSRALMQAVRGDDLAGVRALLDRASRETLRESDEQGFTPLIWAAREGKNEIVRALLAAGIGV